MESRAVAVAVLSLLVAGLPVAAQPQPIPFAGVGREPTTLYFHLLGVEDFPINTQEPDSAWTDESLYGATTATATCLSAVAGNTGGVANEYHTYYGIPLPALVDYDVMTNGMPRVSPQRGLAADVVLDPSVPTRLVWYVSTGSSPSADGGAVQPPAAVPNVVLRATMRPSNAISVDDVAYNADPPIMAGETQPATLAGPMAVDGTGQPAADVRSVGQVGGRWVYEFTLDLEPEATSLAVATGYNIRMDLFVENPSCADPGGEGYTMPNLVGMHTSPGFRPRLELGATDPMWATMRTEVQDGHLILLASVGSAWGAYDVDDGKAVLDIKGPSTPELMRLDVDDSGYGNQGVRSAKVLAWLWPDALEDEPGRYTFSLTVPNLQGTASASATTEFAAAPDGEAPGPSVALLALALVALAVIARRRG